MGPAILYCGQCFEHLGPLTEGNALKDGPHKPFCGGTVKLVKPVYVGVFLTEEAKKELLKVLPAVHPTVFAEHVTLAFGRHMKDRYPLGEMVTVEVVASVKDERGQAAIVRPFTMKKWLWEDQTPHITISCAEGVKPFYSNDMLKNANTMQKLELKLQGVLDYFPRTNAPARRTGA